MRPLRLFFVALPLGLACSSSGGSVELAPTIVLPQDLLDGVTELKISVYRTTDGLGCDATSGTVSGLTTQLALATKDLGQSNCASGAKFCGDVSLDKGNDPLVFAAQAFVGTGSAPVASGCTTATPNQDTLQIKITMLRTLPPSSCNGKQVSGLTQCATGAAGDPVCDANCQSLEVYLSKGDGTTTSDGKPKLRPALVWPSASGDAGRLLAFWADKSQTSGNEVAMRVLGDDMEPYTGQGDVVQNTSFRMPGPNGAIPGQGYPFPQFNPTAASINGNYYVAFEDTSTSAVAIKLQEFNTILAPQLLPNAAQVSDTTGGQALPSMAASGSSLFVAWENSGTIVGKTVSAAGAPGGAQKTLGPGTGVTVAATSSGWVAVWQNGSDVDMATIDSTGTPGAVSKVNSTAGASHPGVAAFGSQVAVIWVDGGGHIVVQRFDSAGKPLAGDQTNSLEDPSLGGNESSPSIAAGADFFVATWVDGGSHVRARFLDATGYRYNAVNGQSTDFQVSTTDGETVTAPVAAVGGSDGAGGAFVAVAWEVDAGSPTFNGIYARRFPLPQK